jgi:hypothetical protein
MGSLLKIAIALWPFIKEMFFAGKSVKQVVMENKLLTFVLFMLAFSVILNFLSFGKLIDIAVTRSDTQPPVDSIARPPPKPPAKAASEVKQKTQDEIDKQLEEIYGPRGEK